VGGTVHNGRAWTTDPLVAFAHSTWATYYSHLSPASDGYGPTPEHNLQAQVPGGSFISVDPVAKTPMLPYPVSKLTMVCCIQWIYT